MKIMINPGHGCNGLFAVDDTSDDIFDWQATLCSFFGFT